jgi:uncharacterized protein YukE
MSNEQIDKDAAEVFDRLLTEMNEQAARVNGALTMLAQALEDLEDRVDALETTRH